MSEITDKIGISKYCDSNRYTNKENEQKENSIYTPNIQGMYSIVYHGLTEIFELNPTTSVLLATIYSLSKKYGYCEASQGTLAKTLGLTVPPIKNALDELEANELIQRSKNVGRYKTYKWKVTEKTEKSIKSIQQQIESRKSKK